MVSLIAYIFGAPEISTFDSAMRSYLRSVEAEKATRRDKAGDFDAFLGWLREMGVSDYVEADEEDFISQCRILPSTTSTVQKQVCGTVTSITDDSGLIDGHIFFDLNGVTGFGNGDVVQLGDRLDVLAISSNDGGWKAITATKISTGDWYAADGESDRAASQTFISQDGAAVTWITAVTHKFYTLNYESTLVARKLEETINFVVGDRVRATITPQGTVSSIMPLQVKDMTGKILYAPKYDKENLDVCDGAINGDVRFSNRVCEDGYVPRRGDEVKFVAIESQQGRHSWRATSITLLSRERRGAKPKSSQSSDWVLRGQYPVYDRKRPSLPSFLPKYPVPEKIRNCVEKGLDVLRLLPALKDTLNPSTHAERFKGLLYLEEISVDLGMRQYRIGGARLERRGCYLCLHVPGLTDGKPSLSVGDIVVVQEFNVGTFGCPEHHGFIHHILLEKEELLIKFHATLQDNFEESDIFDVTFSYSRATFRRCHFAIQRAQMGFCSGFLFPNVPSKGQSEPGRRPQLLNAAKFNNTPGDEARIAATDPIPLFFNSNLNERQRQAVQSVLKGGGTRLPYILFGPPGTGKTVTLVEMILHIYRSRQANRILVCAPSNSAVDVICERLAQTGHVDDSDMTRFNAFKRLEEAIPEAVARFCRSEETVGKTANYRIILTTCVNAGVLYDLGMPRGHITHVCIDEAGQATEPEVLIPLGLLDHGQVIMAGDPKQLGPVIMSPLARLYGLDVSLLERFMEYPMYLRNDDSHVGGFDAKFITKLVNNYRSHASLIKLPSEMFYHGELEPFCDASLCGQFLTWEHLPCQGFPIVFHGLVGQQLRESDCPSLMNPAEIVQAIRYVKLILAERSVEPAEIGIITPYRKQVEKIRIMLRAVGVVGVKVGSVEEFQGQERSVILISTVRSYVSGVPETCEPPSSVRSALGFVSNPKRFNVATTRAKALMIVLGNPFVLSMDERWKSLLHYCVSNRGYTGCDISSIGFGTPSTPGTIDDEDVN